MKFKKLFALLLAGSMAFALAACGNSDGGQQSAAPGESPAQSQPGEPSSSGDALTADVQAIVDRGALRVGVKPDVPGFGEEDILTGEYSGMEVDLARAIADAMGVDIEFTAVTAKTRGQLLDSGDIDLVIATFTVTDERRESWNFSSIYYVDAVSLLVKKDSGISSYADLADKVIGVAESSTSKEALIKAAGDTGVTLTESNFNTFPDYPSIKAALDAGQVNAFCVDGSILTGYLTDDCHLLTDLRFSAQNYGVASKLSNTGLAAYVDELVTGWLADGTIQGFIDANGVPASFVE